MQRARVARIEHLILRAVHDQDDDDEDGTADAVQVARIPLEDLIELRLLPKRRAPRNLLLLRARSNAIPAPTTNPRAAKAWVTVVALAS